MGQAFDWLVATLIPDPRLCPLLWQPLHPILATQAPFARNPVLPQLSPNVIYSNFGFFHSLFYISFFFFNFILKLFFTTCLFYICISYLLPTMIFILFVHLIIFYYLYYTTTATLRLYHLLMDLVKNHSSMICLSPVNKLESQQFEEGITLGFGATCPICTGRNV